MSDKTSKSTSSTKHPLAELVGNALPADAPLEDHLAELVKLNEKASQGFERAASLMSSDQDELLFKTYAAQRERFASLLRSSSEFSDKVAEKPKLITMAEEFLAGAHRTWMSVRANLADSALRVVLKECLRGDKTILESYDNTVKASGSKSATHQMLTEQRADIRAVMETLTRLLNETDTAS